MSSSSSSSSFSSSLLKLFDVVCVDVPCSGDGTFRKAPTLWRKWAGAAAEALQPLQVELLVGAIEACREGGTVAYSTCSLNPVEVGAPIDLCPFWLSSWLNYA